MKAMKCGLLVRMAAFVLAAERLREFYRRVRPFGAWGNVAAESGIEPPRGLGRMVVNWLAGSVMVLSGTFAMGKFLLGFHKEGTIYLAVAVLAAAVIAQDLFKPKSR